ncbi:MAG: hypothetical protein HY329_27080 [Chloroflexi bacterium]|nr:hypothetical protein [Chloroflexota bacterium]
MKAKRERQTNVADEHKRESGMPGGGQGRIDEVGHSGVYPVSSSDGASGSAQIRGEMAWGQRERGAAGYHDSGGSELTTFGEEHGLGGLTAGAAGEPTGAEPRALARPIQQEQQ